MQCPLQGSSYGLGVRPPTVATASESSLDASVASVVPSGRSCRDHAAFGWRAAGLMRTTLPDSGVTTPSVPSRASVAFVASAVDATTLFACRRVIVTNANATVTVTRDATADDAVVLGVVFDRLAKREREMKAATRKVTDGWIKGDLADLRASRDATVAAFDAALDEAWEVLRGLPAGTVAPGGATPQTVALQFFNRNLNRSLNARLTATEARNINKRSFA